MLSVPELSAKALGALRLVLGAMLWWLIHRDAPATLPLAYHRNYSPLAANSLVHALAANEAVWQGVLWVSELAAVLFAIGLFARPAYLVMVGGLLLTRLAWLHSSSMHSWICPMSILLALVVVPWGQGNGFDRWRHTRQGRVLPDASPAYGFAIWAPGVILGMAFAAAAYSKLYESGLAWVTTGAVAYHFVEDAANAPVTWGLWIAAHRPVAVIFSAMAITVELAVLPLALTGRPWLRLIAGTLAASMFAGFYLFQGVVWRPWIIWLVTFLPWAGWRPTYAPLATASRHVAVIGTLAAVQLFAAATRMEIEPLMSPYPMYAGTYTSPADYDAKRRRKYQRVQAVIAGTQVEITGGQSDMVIAAADAITDSLPVGAEPAATVQALCRTADPPPAALMVHIERTALDWTTALVERRVSRTSVQIPCS